MLADSFVALGMKNKQISLGMWKNHIVHKVFMGWGVRVVLLLWMIGGG